MRFPVNLRSTLVQQLNTWYRFQGPVMTVDTACSSSVSALQMAVTDLITGRCNYAVVTGEKLGDMHMLGHMGALLHLHAAHSVCLRLRCCKQHSFYWMVP